MVRALMVMAVLVGCDYSFAPSEKPDTPEPRLSVDAQVRQYVQTYGGSESQYRVILTLEDCDNLARLLESAVTSMENEPEQSEAWRADLGYANAINSRQLDLDC